MSREADYDVARAKVRAYADLGPNWDSYGAHPIHPNTIRRAREFLRQIQALGFPCPLPQPTCDGNVALVWGDEDIDIEFGPTPDPDNGRVQFSWLSEPGI